MSLLLRGASSVRMTPAVGMVPIPLLARQHTRPFRSRNRLAVLIPGDSVLESTTIGGTATFFGIYQNVIGTHCHRPVVPRPSSDVPSNNMFSFV